MHVLKANINGNPNIGLYCYCNDNFCLVPKGISKKLKKNFEEVLKVPVYEASMAGTFLLGVFIAGNENSILVPEIAYENELIELEKYKIKFKIINSELTALGNNLLCNNNSCIINPEYNTIAVKQIEDALDVPVKKGKINDLDIVGSLAKINDKYGLVHNEIKGFEKKFLQSNLKIKLSEGTVNFGSPYISSGLLCNKNGFIIGDSSGGPEIANADEALGFTQ
ncbi:translation initiation factor IF-6 [Candidatus Woesearchaeota archaeon]|nr:translation initiation factor IF-6 [Candidatus Woesearchaeota archaeon]